VRYYRWRGHRKIRGTQRKERLRGFNPKEFSARFGIFSKGLKGVLQRWAQEEVAILFHRFKRGLTIWFSAEGPLTLWKGKPTPGGEGECVKKGGK